MVMALTGLEIYKLLPKKNCGECGPPTCLAFAMALAGNKASLDSCPYVSDEARAALDSASAPPIRSVTIGAGDRKVSIGDETVLFRHDKTFFHEPGIAFEISDRETPEQIKDACSRISELEFDRVGQVLRPNLIGVRNDSQDRDVFKNAASIVAENTRSPLILMTCDPSAASGALEVLASGKPLIYAANKDNYQGMVEVAKKYGCPLAVYGNGLDELAAVTEKVTVLGCKDLVLDPGRRGGGHALADLTEIRRLAIKKRFRPFGFPAIAFVEATDPYHEVAEAGVYVAKYAGIIVMKSFENWQVLPLLTLRQNIYTDPQKPIQVEAKIYSIGEPDDKSPVYVTSNFSLTYFTVEGDIEASRVPAHLMVIDTEGTSVLTAFAAGKFTAERIAESLDTIGIKDRVSHKKIIIPGYVAAMSGKLEEKSGWEVLVGPRESSGIPAFVKAKWVM